MSDSARGDAVAGLRRRNGAEPGPSDTRSFQEAYRVVRANLSVSLADLKRPRVAVTSANAREGKTVTCANLAISFARAGQRVVLVDLDFRHPDAHRLVGGHNRFGVSDLLLGQRPLEECLQYLQLPEVSSQSAPGLYFLATGPTPPNPTELLGSSRTGALLDELGKQADLIFIDAPPVLPVADMLVVGRIVTGVLLVVEARRTALADVARAKNLLVRNQARILGVVLNKVRQRDADYGDYPYSEAGGEAALDGLVPVNQPLTIPAADPAGSTRNPAASPP